MPGYLNSQLQTPEATAAAARQCERLWNTYGEFLSTLRDGPVLEIGPGRGEFLSLLTGGASSANRDIYAVDIDREVVDHTRERFPTVTITHSDAREYIQAGHCQFAAVFMLHVLEHLDADHATALLAAIREQLLPGGIAVIEVPNSACSHVGNTIHSSDITHRVAYTSISLRQICRLAGFTSIEVAGIRPRGNSPARLAQRVAIALLITLDRIRHKIFLPSWHFLHEPTIYAVCKANRS